MYLAYVPLCGRSCFFAYYTEDVCCVSLASCFGLRGLLACHILCVHVLLCMWIFARMVLFFCDMTKCINVCTGDGCVFLLHGFVLYYTYDESAGGPYVGLHACCFFPFHSVHTTAVRAGMCMSMCVASFSCCTQDACM